MSWADYSYIIQSLKKKDYITIKEDFDDNGAKRQYICLEKSGHKDYEELTKLLHQFLDDTSGLYPQYGAENIL